MPHGYDTASPYPTINMRHYSTLTAVLLAAGALALPSHVYRRAEEHCAPVSYTISSYKLETSATAARVAFNLASHFTNATDIVDTVMNGAHCEASGPTLPNNNECQVDARRLLFDLRAPQEKGYYQITHTWTCDGATWMSGTPVQIDPLDCVEQGATRVCSSTLQSVVPQNVRKICNAPRC